MVADVVVLARTVGVERFFGMLDPRIEEAARTVGVGGELFVPLDIADRSVNCNNIVSQAELPSPSSTRNNRENCEF